MGRLSGNFKQQKLSFGFKPSATATPDIFETTQYAGPETFDAYSSAQLSNVYAQYEDEVNKKRKLRAAPSRAYGTRRATADDAAIDAQAEEVSLSNKRRRSAGDDQGHRYLHYLWQHVSKQAVPPELDLQRLTDVVRFHAFHGSKDLSITAYQLMQYLAHLHPVTSSAEHATEDGQQKHSVLTASQLGPTGSKPWVFLDRKFHLDIRHDPDQQSEIAHLYFQKVWEHAANQAEALVGTQASDDLDTEDYYRNFGELCCMKLMLSELQRDLRHRLAVYAKTAKADKAAEAKRHALLQNSQLWRLLQNSPYSMRYGELVLNLMRCIAASAAAEDEQEELNQHTPAMLKKTRPSSKSPSPAPGASEVQPQSAEKFPELAHAEAAAAAERKKKERDDRDDAELQWPVDAEVFGVAETADMAALLLRMILELCGTAEDAGLFCTTGKVRTSMTKYDCTRVKLDRFMIDGLVGAKEVLRTVPEKTAFLLVLHPKDRMRLLGMTVGSRVSRQDENRYPILAEYRAIHNGSTDINTFLHVDPLSILGCVPDMAYHAAKLIHKEGSLDSLAMLTAITVQTALALGMKGGLSTMLPKLLAFFKEKAHGSDRHFVSNNSWALLAAASFAVKSLKP